MPKTAKEPKGPRPENHYSITMTLPGVREDLEIVRAHYESKSGGVPVSAPMAAALAIKAARAAIGKGQA